MPTEEEIFNALDVAEIERYVSLCTRCPLHEVKIKDVPGSGNPNAKILFIGEAPGRNEDLRGEPFVGAAGNFLNKMIEGIGLRREDVFITNVLKHRPPNNRDPRPDEIDACIPYLLREIELIEPELIVFLGQHALNRFFSGFAISKVHGKLFQEEYKGKKMNFLALYHPNVGRFASKREILKTDFANIPKILKKIESEGGNLK